MDPRAAELAAMTTASDAIEPLPQAAQRRVVRWLAGAFEVALEAAPAASSTPQAPPSPPATGGRKSIGSRKEGGAAANPAPRNSKSKPLPTLDKTLNLHPDGKTSFKDFVSEKSPGDNTYEHNVLAVYWLTHVAGHDGVTVDQVFTCYRNAPWKLPHDFRNSLQQTASHKGWLDTKDADDVKITPHGINYVERQLPTK